MTQELLELNKTTSDQLVIIREFDAPKSLVFDVLTEHEHIMKWSSPKNLDVTFSEGDLKVGGQYRFGMQFGEKMKVELTGEYREIIRPDKLAYTQSRVQAEGSSPETLISVTLDEHNGKTSMTFRHVGFPSRDDRDGSIKGWNEAFDKLDAHLATLV